MQRTSMGEVQHSTKPQIVHIRIQTRTWMQLLEVHRKKSQVNLICQPWSKKKGGNKWSNLLPVLEEHKQQHRQPMRARLAQLLPWRGKIRDIPKLKALSPSRSHRSTDLWPLSRARLEKATRLRVWDRLRQRRTSLASRLSRGLLKILTWTEPSLSSLTWRRNSQRITSVSGALKIP